MPVHAGQAMWKYTILTRPKYKLHQTRNDALLNVTLHFSGVNLHFRDVTLHFSDVKCHLVKAISKLRRRLPITEETTWNILHAFTATQPIDFRKVMVKDTTFTQLSHTIQSPLKPYCRGAMLPRYVKLAPKL